MTTTVVSTSEDSAGDTPPAVAEAEVEAVEAVAEAQVEIAQIEAETRVEIAEIHAETEQAAIEANAEVRIAEAEAAVEAVQAIEEKSQWQLEMDQRMTALEQGVSSLQTILTPPNSAPPSPSESLENSEVTVDNPEASATPPPEPPPQKRKVKWL